MNKEVVKSQQIDLLDRLSKESEGNKKADLELYAKVAAFCGFQDQIILEVLGKHALGLKRFLQEIDREHPEFPEWMHSRLSISLLKDVVDTVDVAAYIRNSSNNTVLVDQIKKCQHVQMGYKSMANIDSPSVTLNQTRFLPKDKLELARGMKRTQTVGLRIFYNRGKEVFDSQPNDLMDYARFEDRYKKEIEIAKGRLEPYEKYGLTSMSEVIQASIKELELKSKSEHYMGFNKVSMTSVAAILAKMMGAIYDSGRVYVEMSLWSQKVTAQEKEYAPVLHPWCFVKPHASQKTIDQIERLDALPELSGRAAFDHIWVLLPSFNTERGTGSKQYDRLEIISDLTLIKAEDAVGAVLGDKDGQVYFICYWTRECCA